MHRTHTLYNSEQNIGYQSMAWYKIPYRLSEVTTAHELLELQLRLRAALQPILTAAEIEEILAVPARR